MSTKISRVITAAALLAAAGAQAQDNKTIYITEALSGDVLMAKMPVAGKKMYGLS